MDNSTSIHFPPIFNQYGFSCNQASSIGYVFTYEINRLRGVASDAPERLYSPADKGLHIRYDPELRTSFLAAFEGPQADLWPLFDACAGLPLALIRGANSDLLSETAAAEMRRRQVTIKRELAEGATAARRWMVAALADFSAGLAGADKVAEAVRNYALTQVEYLRTINDYNMNVAQLARLTGELK